MAEPITVRDVDLFFDNGFERNATLYPGDSLEISPDGALVIELYPNPYVGSSLRETVSCRQEAITHYSVRERSYTPREEPAS